MKNDRRLLGHDADVGHGHDRQLVHSPFLHAGYVAECLPRIAFRYANPFGISLLTVHDAPCINHHIRVRNLPVYENAGQKCAVCKLCQYGFIRNDIREFRRRRCIRLVPRGGRDIRIPRRYFPGERIVKIRCRVLECNLSR